MITAVIGKRRIRFPKRAVVSLDVIFKMLRRFVNLPVKFFVTVNGVFADGNTKINDNDIIETWEIVVAYNDSCLPLNYSSEPCLCQLFNGLSEQLGILPNQKITTKVNGEEKISCCIVSSGDLVEFVSE